MFGCGWLVRDRPRKEKGEAGCPRLDGLDGAEHDIAEGQERCFARQDL